MRGKNYFARLCLGAALTLIASPWNARALTPTTVVLPDSTRPVDASPSTSGSARRPYVSRQTLTAAETNAPITFEVALKMHNLPELQARISRGERISPQEMADQYEPSAADYQAVVDWLKGEGLTIVREDSHHLAVFVRGKVGHVASSLNVTFARVTAGGKEYTSAISAPSVPAKISSLLIGINGLQPHIRAHKHLIKQSAQPNASTGSAAYLPIQIAQAYGASGLYSSNITGAGQTIAIVIDTFPSTTDLLLFWKNCNIGQSINNIQFVQPVTGFLPQASQGIGEETLDVEWSSAMAPGAHIRVYAATDLGAADLDTAYQQVIDDATNHPEWGIHQMSMSYGIGELDAGKSQLETDDAKFVELANLGVTSFASSGDNGPTPDSDSGDYSIQVESPASDPNVTGVGGTRLQLNVYNAIGSEVVWNDSSGASGGGTSAYFPAPSWQGLAAGSNREVPDVAASADPDYGAIIYFTGAKTVVGGTSWASPTWAGLCALINQARANAGQAPLGTLGPHIYPLVGTANLHDIVSGNNDTSGSNGFSAGVGYDKVTGVGSPNAQSIAETLVGSSTLVGVQMEPAMQSLTPGQSATFSVAVGGSSATYQWQRRPIGSTSYGNLSDGGAYSGSGTSALTVSNATEAMSGDSFQCVITLTSASITTTPSVLTVDSPLDISLLAGAAGVGALADGNGSAANFYIPSGIALDSSGNLYIADYSNNAIREVTPGGTVTTPYGSKSAAEGSTNGSGNSALFNGPNGVAIDSSGNIYVADTANNLIRKITSGTVSTFAGAGGQFNTPEGVAVDTSGNVYVADTLNDCIRKITPGGSVATVAGQVGDQGYEDGAATTAALFNEPSSVAVDGSGNIYVADTGNCVIRKISTTGTVTTLAGQATVSGYLDGAAATALFNCPAGITVDSFGNVYVADCLTPVVGTNGAGNDLVRRITTTGVVSTLAGQPGNEGTANGIGTAAQFYSLQALAINNTTGEFYFADTYNNTIREGILVPTISVAATQEAMVVGPTPGEFTVTRSGSPLGSVSLGYSLSGTAVAGTDYQALPGTVTIPFGENSVEITVNPLANGSATSDPELELTLNSSNAYLPGDPYTATLTIQEEATPYQNWAVSHFGSNSTNPGIAGEAADPNNNGVPNLLEYAFNSNPLQTGTEPLPVVTTVQDSNGLEHLAITYTEINTDPNLTCTVQVTSDLMQVTDQWHSGSSYTTVVPPTPTVNGNVTTWTVMDNTAISTVSKRFIRLQVSEN
jgi:kumamolisin